MTAFSTLDPCEAVMQGTAVQITMDILLYVGPEKTVFPCKLVVINLFQPFKVVLDTLVVLGFLGFWGW